MIFIMIKPLNDAIRMYDQAYHNIMRATVHTISRAYYDIVVPKIHNSPHWIYVDGTCNSVQSLFTSNVSDTMHLNSGHQNTYPFWEL